MAVDGKISNDEPATDLAGSMMAGIQSGRNKKFPGELFATAEQGGKADSALQPTQNLSDLDDAATARENLGLEIGADVQAHSDNLDDWSAVAPSAKQDASANLSTLAGITPGAAGQAILAAATEDGAQDAAGAGDAGKELFTAATRRAAMDLIVGPSHYNALNSGLNNGFSGDMGAILNELLGDGVATGSGGDGVNALPEGCELHIPIGSYRITTPVVQKRFVNIRVEGDANIQSIHTSANPIWTISIENDLTGNSDAPRNMYFGGGGRMVNFAGGKEALLITQDAGGEAQFRTLVEHIRLSGYDPANGTLAFPALRMTGYASGSTQGPTFCDVSYCTLVGGIHFDDVADGNTMQNCMLLGSNARGVIIDVVPGAARTLIRQNCITTGQGSLEVLNGSQWDFVDNQCEQGSGAINTLLSIGGTTTMIAVRGADAGSGSPTIQSGLIRGNNIGCGINLVDTGFIVDWAEDVVIEDNTHFAGTLYFDGRLTANSRYNHIGRPRQLRGTRTSGNGFDSRTDKKFRVQDLGEGNTGLEVGLTTVTTLQNNFTNSNCYLRRDRYGRVYCEGAIAVGATFTASILIATLPAGMRPFASNRFSVPINDEIGIISINTSGEIRLVVPTASIASGHIIYMGGISFATQARDTFDGSD